MAILAIVIAVLVAVFLVLVLASKKAVQQAEAEFPPIGEFVTVEGVRIHYLCQGSGKAVVLIHGNTGFIQDFTPEVFNSAAQAYRTFAFDRPGHGYSDRPRNEAITAIDQARLLREALQQLGIETPIIVGYSWGGSVALGYALEYPNELSGLVLLGALAFRRERLNPLLEIIAETPIIGDLFRAILPVVLGRNLVQQNLIKAFAPDTVPANYLRIAQALWTRPSQTLALTQDNLTINPTLAALSPRYSQIRVPVVIVTGNQDQIVNAQANSLALHQVVMRSELIELPKTGHAIPKTRPQIVIDAIRRVESKNNSIE
ncbi:MAG: alpha/beta fold hydrolase [Aulosira sp. ZfuVER01]|nr:alpha/beta hydrolase [Aulosira sp. ZfuVER01]MDZ7998220.1 alpha/beta hydrolase [Aulosira sp. DedVER01a]MDZ8055464.1 alpha/beta hydrolase [Aulosira sp. ZfuCHP01]